ncbi:MAG: RsmD family RNA methyltransferase [Bacteroidetes bacterium]|nr:RsmD family RNA methyltransferase [Bacteroidota bacterium]
MRIISGIHGGRKITPPSNMPYTRPTTDIAKEGLFNVIQNNLDIDQLKVLDLFGGTGCISYELSSRGAPDITIIEKDTQMYDFIKKTSAELELEHFKVVKQDVFKFIESATGQYDFIFAGPPYALKNIDDLPLLIFQKQLLKPKGWFILEHTPRNDYKNFAHYKTERTYGTTIFSIFIN